MNNNIFQHAIKKPVFFMSDRDTVDKRTIFKHNEAHYIYSSSVADDTVRFNLLNFRNIHLQRKLLDVLMLLTSS